mgnify:CR=1 FL=1
MTASGERVAVVGGVDTHADTIHVAAINQLGRTLADQQFPTTPVGYGQALRFLAGLGQVEVIGVEGTSSFGAGFTRAARGQGVAVVEVVRPDRAARRRLGKSDPIDAYQAARAALASHRTAAVKDESIEGIRALHNARRSAVKAHTAALNQIHAMLVSAPSTIREQYRHRATDRLVDALRRVRLTAHADPVERAVLTALRSLAHRAKNLADEHTRLGRELDALVRAANPGLRATVGVGPDTAAQLLITAGGNPERLHREASFAALCGVAPVPASSGKTTRHRLARGGDRAANNALYRIALVRMSCDQRTKDFVTRQRTAGRSTKEILRLLKRALAREVFRALTRPVAVPGIGDLRPLRQSKNLTLTAAANHFGVWPSVISRLERGVTRDDQLADNYRQWLTAA